MLPLNRFCSNRGSLREARYQSQDAHCRLGHLEGECAIFGQLLLSSGDRSCHFFAQHLLGGGGNGGGEGWNSTARTQVAFSFCAVSDLKAGL